MKAYYGAKTPADWAQPGGVSSMTLCKLTGQPATDIPLDLAIADLVLTPDPNTPPGTCGSPASDAGSASVPNSNSGSG